MVSGVGWAGVDDMDPRPAGARVGERTTISVTSDIVWVNMGEEMRHIAFA